MSKSQSQSKTIASHFEVYDNDAKVNLCSLDTFSVEFETLEEAVKVARRWKDANGHSITVNCIYTVEAEFVTL